MRTLLCYILFVLPLMGCDVDDVFPEAENALANGDMETTSTINDTQAAGWTIRTQNFNPPNNYDYGQTSETAFNGDYCLFISTSQVDSPNEFYYFRQDIPADSIDLRSPLQLAVSVKTENLSGNGFDVRLIAWDALNPNAPIVYSTASAYETRSVNGTNDWETYYLNLPVLPLTVTAFDLDLILSPSTSGTVYFDDVKLSYLE